ncbi:MAG: pantoate--beta-alanine ligase [Thermoanaerobaculia bacterium]|nr:pantoate--beta-alanine ligase [Thermoanaerobaculia bacterium]MBP9145998.1 pantoate--beta-alanine ligase [Thermoanaerobaculia bacterium]MBP9825497.1 pantoate--beta-alanine ligase [Thermoanaerobaculia bacterium]
MKTVHTAAGLENALSSWRSDGATIAFVPTMGALHEGHLSLIAIARRHAPRVVASIFVNPSQFAPHEDFESYPRHPERDAALLARAGCDLLFLPDRATVYPEGFGTWIEPRGAAMGLESEVRPHFFRGVATVVARLLRMVRPDIAVFGEKDAQQLAVVRQLVRDLLLPVEIVGGPIVREADGLAMSSRNAYLSAEERRRAVRLSRALARARLLFDRGERQSATLCEAVALELAADPEIVLHYVEVVDPDSFAPVAQVGDRAVVALAAKIGTTRLIDNVRLES